MQRRQVSAGGRKGARFGVGRKKTGGGRRLEGDDERRAAAAPRPDMVLDMVLDVVLDGAETTDY